MDRDRDERYDQLVELAPDGILVHDGGRIMLANAAAVRLAGGTRRGQLIGRPIETFLAPPYLKAVQAELTDSLSPTELAPPVRDRFRRLDGTEVAVEVRTVAFVEHGHPAAHLVIRDITERLALEDAARLVNERLQQAQKMESVGVLAGGVAHEVNNMMSVILGFGGFLLRDKTAPAQNIADIREIMKAADRAAAITRQLLAFSRTAEHKPEVVDLGDAVRNSEPVVRQLLGEAVQLVVNTEAAARVWIDPGQLEQVIVNLAINARDATPAGGVLVVSTAETDVASEVCGADGVAIPLGHYATLRVRDNGTGMDAATQARIFEPFFTTKPVGEGTGLGLAAVHGIVTQNGGYVTVASAPGEGAAFTLYLPVLPHSDTVEAWELPPDGGLPTHAGATVLIVDDEVALRAVAARILAQDGFRILEAWDGADALEMIERDGPPQLVLTDLLMPRMGGVQLAAQLRARWPALPVLFMSGYSPDVVGGPDKIEAYGTLIEKPFTPAALLAGVTAALAPTPAVEQQA